MDFDPSAMARLLLVKEGDHDAALDVAKRRARTMRANGDDDAYRSWNAVVDTLLASKPKPSGPEATAPF